MMLTAARARARGGARPLYFGLALLAAIGGAAALRPAPRRAAVPRRLLQHGGQVHHKGARKVHHKGHHNGHHKGHHKGAVDSDVTTTTLPTNATAATLYLISAQQAQLLDLIAHARMDMAETQKRLGVVLESADKTVGMVEDLVNRSNVLNTTAITNNEYISRLRATYPTTLQLTNTTVQTIDRVNASYTQLGEDLEEQRRVESADARAEDGFRILDIIEPQLKEIDSGVLQVEAQLHGGNITKVVEDCVRDELTNILEDNGRGFAADDPT